MATDSLPFSSVDSRGQGAIHDPRHSRVTFMRPSHLHSIEDPNALRLRINRVSLVQQLNVDPVIEHLRREKILSDGDVKLILKGSSKPDRTRLLLDVLPTKDHSTQWYTKFRESLQKSGEADAATQRQHSMLVAFLDNTIVQRPLQMPPKPAAQKQRQLVEAAAVHSRSGGPLPEIPLEADAAVVEHKAQWKALKAAANSKALRLQPQALAACGDRLTALPQELVAAYRAWRSDKSEALLRREKEALKRVRAADRFLLAERQLQQQKQKQQKQRQQKRLLCLHAPVKRLLKDAKYFHMAFKHVHLLATRHLVQLAPALATSYTGLVGSFIGWSPFAARKLARHGFRLFDFLEGLCEFRLCETVAAALAEFAKRGSGLESLVPSYRASVRLMEARLNNAQLPLADAARLAASDVAARIANVSFGQDLLNQSELLALSGRLLLDQGSLLPAQTCFGAAINKVDLTDMNTVFKVLYYSLDVYLIRHEEIKAEKVAVACVQHANKFFKPHSPQYVKALLNYVKFSNTFKRDAFGVEVATNAVLFAHTVMGYAHPLLADAQSLLALARLLLQAASSAPSAEASPPQGPPPDELALAAAQTGQDAHPAGHPMLANLIVNFGQAVLLESTGPGGGGQSHRHYPAAVSHCRLAVATLSDVLGERSPATVRARLVLAQLLALAGLMKLAGEQMRRAHRALARGGAAGESADGMQQQLPQPPATQQQQPRSHVLLRFLLEYARFLRQSGHTQQALRLARQVTDTTECYGAYIHWVDEAFTLTLELLAESRDAAGYDEAARRRSEWQAGHPVYRSRLDWQAVNASPDKAFFKKFNLWTERRVRIMGKLKKMRKAETGTAKRGGEDGARRLKKALKEFAEDSEERFGSSSSSSDSGSGDESNDEKAANGGKKKALKKRKELVRFKSDSSDSDAKDKGKGKGGKEKDGKEKDGKEKDGKEKDGKEKDGKEKDGKEKDGKEKDGKKKDGKEKDGKKKDGKEKGGKGKKPNDKKAKSSSASGSSDEEHGQKQKAIKKSKSDRKSKEKAADGQKKRKEKEKKKGSSDSSSSSTDSDKEDKKPKKEKKEKEKSPERQKKNETEKREKKKKESGDSSTSSSESDKEDKNPKKEKKLKEKSQDHQKKEKRESSSSADSDNETKKKAKNKQEKIEEQALRRKVILIGDAGVGKSSLLHRFVHDSFDQKIRTTIGLDFCTKNLKLKGQNVICQVWDTAGQERYRSLLVSYFRDSQCAMIVYDVNNRASFESCARWLSELRSLADPDVAVMLLGNKCDLEQPQAVTKKEAKEFAKAHGAAFAEVSAAADSTKSVAKAFRRLVKKRVDGSDSDGDSSSDCGNTGEQKKQMKKKKKSDSSSSSDGEKVSSTGLQKDKKEKEIHKGGSDILLLYGSG